MDNSSAKKLAPILYFPHGGGPMPLLGDEGHQTIVAFWKDVSEKLPKPKAIVVISAHWVEDVATITGSPSPALIYDYFGFPEEAYQITYPAPGEPKLAAKLLKLLGAHRVKAQVDNQRGFDHGLFVPLKIMYPEANIPCIQLSLLNSLDAGSHIRLGKALSRLRKEEELLIIGSGFSFHNLQAFFADDADQPDAKNSEFEGWLVETCTNASFSEADREKRLTDWENAPFARYCHPREEHLLPLHVCYGIAQSPAKLVFSDHIMGKRASAYLW